MNYYTSLFIAALLLVMIGCGGSGSPVNTNPNPEPTSINYAVDLEHARGGDSGSAIAKEVGRMLVYWIVDESVKFAVAILYETADGLEASINLPLSQDSNMTVMVELDATDIQQAGVDDGIAWLGGLCYIRAGQNNTAEVGPPGTKPYCAYLYGHSLIEDGELSNFAELDIEDLHQFIEETADEYLSDVDPIGLFQMGIDFLGGIWEQFVSQFNAGYNASIQYLENVLSRYEQ
ncbi:MAG: hypothetical protein V1807_01505 [Patescibacteria group bacterium]